MTSGVQIVFVLVFGCVVGSFLNVVRYRLPRKAGMVSGRSMCPKCGRRIAWYDNVPILSYLALRGRCRRCGWGIPWIYPVIEASTGASFALIWYSFPPGHAVAYMVLAALLIVCAGIDADLRIIPDKLTLPGIVLGLVFSVTLLKTGPVDKALVRSLLGIVAGGGTLFGVAVLYKLVRRIEGMGGGDVKLMAMVGAFLGYKLALLTIFVGSVAGGIIGLFLIHRSSEGMKTSVPFGVFLSPAGIFCLLWGDVLIGAYLSLIK